MMEKGLGALVGKDVKTAFDVLGNPSAKQEVGGETVYIWQLSKFESYSAPRTSPTYGSIGNIQALGTSTSSEKVLRSDTCRVKMIAANSGQIILADYEGNSSACSSFSERLGKYYNQQSSR
jgi:hypothetical protein